MNEDAAARRAEFQLNDGFLRACARHFVVAAGNAEPSAQELGASLLQVDDVNDMLLGLLRDGAVAPHTLACALAVALGSLCRLADQGGVAADSSTGLVSGRDVLRLCEGRMVSTYEALVASSQRGGRSQH